MNHNPLRFLLSAFKTILVSVLVVTVFSYCLAAGQESVKTHGFVHPRARIQNYPEDFKIKFEKKGIMDAESAISRAVEILRNRGIGRLCICEVSWIAAPVSGYLIDALGDFSFDGNHFKIFRLGITDCPQSTGNPDFPMDAGEEFVFIAKGLSQDGLPRWFPPPGPDTVHDTHGFDTRSVLAYEFLFDRASFETLPQRFSPCPSVSGVMLGLELLEACRRGNFRRAFLAIEEGADIDTRDETGVSPLIMAIGSGQKDLAITLIEKGSDVNLGAIGGGKTIKGYTPLLSACENGDREMVNLLLAKGAKMNVADESGRSPLYISLTGSHFGICDLLVQKGVDINFKDQDGNTPLAKSVSRGNPDNLVWLLKHGASTEIRNQTGETALMMAAACGNLNAVRILVKAGAPISSRDKKGWPALALASFAGHESVVRHLISIGKASARISNHEGTPLIVEAARRLSDTIIGIIKILIANGASANSKDGSGSTALQEAARRQKWKMVRFLVEHGADINYSPPEQPPVLTQAYWDKCVDLVEWLLERGADPEKRFQGRDPFWIWPFVDKNPELVRLTLSHARSPDIMDERQATPLMWASRMGWNDIIVWLLEKGADPNLASRVNKTALMEAAEKGHLEIIGLLIKYGAIVQDQTEKGWTALMWASEKGYDSVVEKLLAAGANPKTINRQGQSSLDIAKLNRKAKTAAILEAAMKQFPD